VDTSLKHHRSISYSALPPALSLFLLIGMTQTSCSQAVDPTSEPSAVSISEAASVTDSSVVTTAESQIGNPPNKQSDWNSDAHAWQFIVYPAYVWVPFFSSSVTLPGIPSPPGGGGSVIPSGTTSGSFDSAAFAGAQVYKDKWEGTATFLYAGLSATRTTPRVTLTMDFIYGQAMVGRYVYKGLAFEGGFRRLAMDLTATVGTYPSVGRTPGYWDPLLGVTYRKQLSKKWRMTGHIDGGGFGVGSDIDIGASASADWRFAKHFGMTMGGAYLHLEDSNTVLAKTLTIKPTMYGPTFGLGIYF
jgi:hypothetical protein